MPFISLLKDQAYLAVTFILLVSFYILQLTPKGAGEKGKTTTEIL